MKMIDSVTTSFLKNNSSMIEIQKINISQNELSHYVAHIEGWMATYFLPPFDGTGGIGGPIATYWTSSPYMAGPYVMNSYGAIRGLCVRAKDEGADRARLRAEQLALYYLRSQDPTSGFVVCCWGEEPFRGNGLVQQASVAAALWDLHNTWPHPEVARAAQKCWRGCLTNASMRADWQAHNMALRACEALMLGIQARGDAKPASKERALLRRVGRQVAKAQWHGDSPVAGAIPQSLSDDALIMPYQGKCLNPLIMLAEFLDEPHYLDMAKGLADFIVRNMAIAGETGPLLRGKYTGEGDDLAQARRLYRFRRLFPFLEPNLRRLRHRKITHWSLNPWPQWVARGMDTARGLYHLGQTLGEQHYLSLALAMVQKAMHFQTPLGGLRNTIGFFGENPQDIGGLVWQDAAANPRWNSYAVQFLHELAAGTPVVEPVRPEADSQDFEMLSDNQNLLETVHELRLVNGPGEVMWRVHKGHRWGRPFRPIAQWNEGGSFSGRDRKRL
jgi:hypothetical protein